jgi:hypothetical protein
MLEVSYFLPIDKLYFVPFPAWQNTTSLCDSCRRKTERNARECRGRYVCLWYGKNLWTCTPNPGALIVVGSGICGRVVRMFSINGSQVWVQWCDAAAHTVLEGVPGLFTCHYCVKVSMCKIILASLHSGVIIRYHSYSSTCQELSVTPVGYFTGAKSLPWAWGVPQGLFCMA